MPRAEIATHQATYTLDQLHQELAGKIIDNKSEARRLAQSMRHVEAVLKLLDPTYNLRRIAVRRRKPNPWFKRGTVFRGAIDVLRNAASPMSAGEITAAMLERKGIKEPDPNAVRDLTGAVQASLSNHNGKSVIGSGHHPRRWKLKKDGN
jgi:hypothetical protein